MEKFFSIEDNENLYKSNLDDKHKEVIAFINEIIVMFIKERFSKETGDRILEKIKNTYNTVQYETKNTNRFRAAFNHQENNLEKMSFIINNRETAMKEENIFVPVYFHEFSHYISHIMNFDKKPGTIVEEGIADLFSDELVKYYNDKVGKNILSFKESTYETSGSIVKTMCYIKGSSIKVLEKYYNDSSDIYAYILGEKDASVFEFYEENNEDVSCMYKKQKEILKSYYNKSDLLETDMIYILHNALMQEEIYNQLAEKKLSREETQKLYPNITQDFYRTYGTSLTHLKYEKEDIINSDNINESEIDAFINDFLKEFNIYKYKNVHRKMIDDNYVTDFLLQMIELLNIIKFNLEDLIGPLYCYEKLSKKEEFNENELVTLYERIGFSALQEDYIIYSLRKAKEEYNKNKAKNSEIYFEELVQKIRQLIKSSLINEKNCLDLKNEKNNIEEFINKQKIAYEKMGKNTEIFVLSIFEYYIKEKSKNLKLTVDSFAEVKKELENMFEEKSDVFDNIVARIILLWNIDNVSIYDVAEIFDKYGLELYSANSDFNEIRFKGLYEVESEENINNYLRFVDGFCSKNIPSRNSFFFNVNNANTIIDLSKVIKKIISHIYKYFDNNMDNEAIKQRIENDDYNFISFYEFHKTKPLTKREEKYIKENFPTKNVEEGKSISTYFSSFIFDKEIYQKLKGMPSLAATYISWFLERKTIHNSCGMINVLFDKIKKYDYPLLRNNYLEVIMYNVNNIDRMELRYDDVKYGHLSEALKLIRNIFEATFINNEQKNIFYNKVFDCIYKKLEIIDSGEITLYPSTEEGYESIKKDLINTMENVSDENLLLRLNQIYEFFDSKTNKRTL